MKIKHISELNKQTISMLEMLPGAEQKLANELIKRLVLAWDTDFTKATPDEIEAINKAHEEFQRGEYLTHDEIDWD